MARISLGPVVRICLIFVGNNGAGGIATAGAGSWLETTLGQFVPDGSGLTSQGAERMGSPEHDSNNRPIPWALDCNNS